MAALMPKLAPSPVWTMISAGDTSVAIAERDALGTTARIAVWPPRGLRPAIGAVDAELARLDLAASRFRSDSEISRIQAGRAGERFQVSENLAEVIAVALDAARWSDGRVDPTVGATMAALGYDRDFVLIGDSQTEFPLVSEPVPGWRQVSFDGRTLSLPAGVRLDFGATAKGLGADRAARAALAATGAGGVLVSLGGDLATGGESPAGGWPVLIADDHRQTARSSLADSPDQLVRLPGGAIATSSTACRQWRRAGVLMHHIVDPRNGQPAAGPWRTVSVAAATCAEANAAATAAIVSGADATSWLSARGIPARLVGHAGEVTRVAGWPATEGGELTVPPPMMPGGSRAGSERWS